MGSGWKYGQTWDEYIAGGNVSDNGALSCIDSLRRMYGAASDRVRSILGNLDSVEERMDVDGVNPSGLDVGFLWGNGLALAGIPGMNDPIDNLLQGCTTAAQTRAYEQFEVAREAFRRGLHAECLESLSSSINGDSDGAGYKLEWRFHHLFGVIRLGFFGCDPDLVSPPDAEQAFVLAARYARPTAPTQAATAMLAAAWSSYVDGRLPDAIRHSGDAVGLDGALTEAVFHLAKFHAAAASPELAMPLLRKAISDESAYAVKAAADPDFQNHEGEMIRLFEAMRHEALAGVRKYAGTARERANGAVGTAGSVSDSSILMVRCVNLAEGVPGLLDILDCLEQLRDYGDRAASAGAGDRTDADGKGRAGDCLSVREMERKRHSWKQMTRLVNKTQIVTEQYQVQEETQEERVVRPASFLRPAVIETVPIVRTVNRFRDIEREGLVDEQVWVNELGDVWQAEPSFAEFINLTRFVRVGAGKFIMGSPHIETNRLPDERRHVVTLSRSFEIMTTPVTQDVWAGIMDGNPSQFPGDRRPVENVTWDEVQEFLVCLNRIDFRYRYRLPTEAQWEYACRAGTTGPRYDSIDNISWYRVNSDEETHPVAKLAPNGNGLYDMLGNVSEWCSDWYGEYSPRDQVNPVGPSSGLHRVTRGGSFRNAAGTVRAAYRGGFEPSTRSPTIGFRLVRTPVKITIGSTTIT